MKQGKQTKTLKVRSLNGLMTPVRYRGEIVRIRDEAIEFNLDELPYESKLHIEAAINQGAVEKVVEQKNPNKAQGETEK